MDTPFTLDQDALSDTDFSTADTLIENDDGSVDVVVSPQEQEDVSSPFDENLVNLMSEEELAELGALVISGFDSDKKSREGWENTIDKGLDLIGIDLKEMTEPFEGACGATHPLILESAVKFQAKASKELFPTEGPVRARILGKKTEEKLAQANRVQNHMNYQITEQITDYFPSVERLLLYTSLVGIAFRKMNFDRRRNMPVSEFVPADQFIVPANATNLKTCPRYTHILYKTELDMKRDFASGLYKYQELGTPSQPDLASMTKKFNKLIGICGGVDENDSVYTLLEQHVDLCLKADPLSMDGEIPLPYIVTVDRATQKVLSVYRNWSVSDPLQEKLEWFSTYPFVPGFGFYSLGFIHLLGNFELTLTSCIRSLVDAGQFANLQGGFKAKGMKITNNDPHSPGEWKEVEAAGMDLQKSLMLLPYKEPSQTLLAMLQYLEGRGQKFADSTEQVVSEASSYGPVGTTLALLEASTKFFSGIHKRLHYAQKCEFNILKRINADFLPQEYPYDVVGGERTVYAQDYDNAVDVIPVSDPNISSNAHKMTLAQTKLEAAKQFPGVFDNKKLLREWLTSFNDGTDVNELIPPDEEAKQQDPISDIMSAAMGKPIKAFPGQDHDAHIRIKQLWIQDPQNGKNPLMAAAANSLVANIREHMMLRYQTLMSGAIHNASQGNPANISEALMAEAASMVAQVNAAKAGMEGTQDPMMIAALASKQEAETNAKKVEYDRDETAARLAIDAEKARTERLKVQAQMEEGIKALGLEAMTKAVDNALKQAIADNKNQTALDIAKENKNRFD